jgi:hypothetical protein
MLAPDAIVLVDELFHILERDLILRAAAVFAISPGHVVSIENARH